MPLFHVSVIGFTFRFIFVVGIDRCIWFVIISVFLHQLFEERFFVEFEVFLNVIIEADDGLDVVVCAFLKNF
jgi:hypothetical protein